MVSLWLPVLFFARGAATDFLRGLAMKAGHSAGVANAMLRTVGGRTILGSSATPPVPAPTTSEGIRVGTPAECPTFIASPRKKSVAASAPQKTKPAATATPFPLPRNT